MRRHIVILLLVLCVLPMTAKPAKAKSGKNPAVEMLSTEREQQFTYYWYAARQAIQEERYDDAYALLQFCLFLNPNDAMTLEWLGILYNSLGNESLGMEYLRQAYTIAPQDHWEKYLEKLLQQYIREGKWREALRVQDEIDRHQPYDVYSALTRYRIYATWGKYKKAIEAIDQYLRIDPENIRMLQFRLELMELTHAKPKALFAMYERLLELDPYNLTIINNYAWNLATHGGDLKKAEKLSAITIKEQPSNAVFLDTYGWIMHLLGEDELALFYLNRALWNADENTKKEIEGHIRVVNK